MRKFAEIGVKGSFGIREGGRNHQALSDMQGLGRWDILRAYMGDIFFYKWKGQFQKKKKDIQNTIKKQVETLLKRTLKFMFYFLRILCNHINKIFVHQIS